MIEGAAASVSLLCLVHCLALPVLLLLPATLGLFVQSEWLHMMTVFLALPMAGIAIGSGYRQHASALPPLIAAIGMSCLIMALVGGPAALTETCLMVCGSGILMLSHFVNWRLRTRAG